MLLLALCIAGLAPGAATVWLLHQRGWLLAIAAGVGVTVSLPGLLIVAMIWFWPLAAAVAGGAAVCACQAYDDGRLWAATVWVSVVLVAAWCGGMG